MGLNGIRLCTGIIALTLALTGEIDPVAAQVGYGANP